MIRLSERLSSVFCILCVSHVSGLFRGSFISLDGDSPPAVTGLPTCDGPRLLFVPLAQYFNFFFHLSERRQEEGGEWVDTDSR